MIPRAACLVGVLAALSGCTAASITPETPDQRLDVYGRLPGLENLALSPDGSRLALVKTIDEQRAIYIVSLADDAVLRKVRVGTSKLRELRWADDEHLLLTTSVTAVPRGLIGIPSEWAMLQTYDVTQDKVAALLEHGVDSDTSSSPGLKVRTMNVAIGPTMVRRLNDRTVIFVAGFYVTDTVRPGLFRVDLATGDETLIRKGSKTTKGWVVDENGEVVATEDYSETDHRWTLSTGHHGDLQESASGYTLLAYPQMLGLDSTGHALLVKVSENGYGVWKTLSLDDGTLGTLQTATTTFDDVIGDRASNRVIGGVRVGDDAEHVFFDATLQTQWDSILRAFSGERVRLISLSDDHSKAVVLVSGERSGFTYQLVDFARHAVQPVGPVYSGLERVAETKSISYPAADGLPIPAYLTLPPGRPPTKLPLIVLAHGGPAAHDTSEFDWWAQALATQGYAVLQSNYRGSDTNPTSIEAGFGEWGRKMQTDLSDGVRFLARDGTIDPARVCIAGASYGGYAALAGVTLDPGVYRCAVSVAGLSDLKGFLRWVNDRSGRGISQRYWDLFMGVSGPDDPVVDSISPIKHVAAVSVPIMLVHGRDDTIVPYAQSEAMADDLEDAGKPVELVALDSEDHWLSRSATRLQMLRRSVAFLRAHNPPDP